MKTQKIKLLKKILLLLTLCVVLLGAGCDDDDGEYSKSAEGYIVGSFIADEVNTEGQATGNKTERGYCILLEGNEDKSMDFYTFNFPDTLFSFPDDILTPNYNGGDCGPTFFPDSLKYTYKIKFKYQIVDESDKVQFITGACTFAALTFPWENYDQATMNKTMKRP